MLVLEEMKAELEEMLSNTPLTIDMSKERTKELFASIEKAELELENAELQNDPERAKLLKAEAEEMKAELEEMLSNTPLTIDMSRLDSIKEDISRRDVEIKELERSLGGGNDELLQTRIQALLKSTSGFSTMNLDTKDPALRLGIIKFLGGYRDALNKRVLYTPDDAEAKGINKELHKIGQVLPQLHREAIYDKKTYGEVLKAFIKDKYQINPSNEAIQKIKEEGLSDNVVETLMADVREKGTLTKQKEGALFKDISESQRARSLLDPKNGKISLLESSSISGYLEQFNRFDNETGTLISDSNDFHAAVSQSSNGNYYVVGGKGRIGVFLGEAEKYEKEGNYEKLTQLNRASAYLDMHGRVNSEAVSSYLNKISYRNNSIKAANTDLLQRTMASNRSARERNKSQQTQTPSPSMN